MVLFTLVVIVPGIYAPVKMSRIMVDALAGEVEDLSLHASAVVAVPAPDAT